MRDDGRQTPTPLHHPHGYRTKQRSFSEAAQLPVAQAIPPELSHAERVAANFPEGTWEHDVALYHDHIEDHLGDVPEHLLPHVQVLTRRLAEEYFVYIERIADSGDLVAIRVKLADLEDNLARCRGKHGGVPNGSLAHRYGSAWAILNDCAQATYVASETEPS